LGEILVDLKGVLPGRQSGKNFGGLFYFYGFLKI